MEGAEVGIAEYVGEAIKYSISWTRSNERLLHVISATKTSVEALRQLLDAEPALADEILEASEHLARAAESISRASRRLDEQVDQKLGSLNERVVFASSP